MSGKKTPEYNGILKLEYLDFTKCSNPRCPRPAVVKANEGGSNKLYCQECAEELRQYAKKNNWRINVIGVTNMTPYDLDKSGRPLLPRGEEAIRAPRTVAERESQAGDAPTEQDMEKLFKAAYRKQPEKPEVKTQAEAWTQVKEVCRLTHTTFPTGCGDSLHIMVNGEKFIVTLVLRKDRKSKVPMMTPVVHLNGVEFKPTIEQIGGFVDIIGGKYRGTGRAWAMYWPHS